jgi:hypothetical protein
VSEVLSYEDLRLIANAVRRYRTVIERKAQQRGQPPSNAGQLDRIERIIARLAAAKKGSVDA